MKIMRPTNIATGFFITAASALLAVVTAIVYGVIFSGIDYKVPVFSAAICVLLAVAAVVAVALLLLGKQFAGFAPAVLCVCTGISLMIFIEKAIWPISDTAYGIEPFPQFAQLIFCAVLILVNFIVSEVALYMKQYRQETNNIRSTDDGNTEEA